MLPKKWSLSQLLIMLDGFVTFCAGQCSETVISESEQLQIELNREEPG